MPPDIIQTGEVLESFKRKYQCVSMFNQMIPREDTYTVRYTIAWRHSGNGISYQVYVTRLRSEYKLFALST